MAKPLTSIILPVRNQADHIRSIVHQFGDTLNRLDQPHELLLVVNASRDASLTVCRELSTDQSSVRVLESKVPGWGHAVRLGLYEAHGDLLCYTNSARTSAQDLALLIMYASAFSGVAVKANRKIREGWQRRLGSLLYNLECRALFDLSYWDINGTPKVFPRSFSKLLSLTRDDDLIDLEFNVTCRIEQYPLIEVPIFSYRRHGGRSTTTMRTALHMYWGAYAHWRAMRHNNQTSPQSSNV
jgi:glycosyltransferase involved in cell wall biosynthesis